jgi:hypothetical protein
MEQGYYIDGFGTRHLLDIPNNGIDMTQSFNSSRTVDVLLKQNEEQRKQNKRLFILSIVTSLISASALVVSIIALFIGKS